MLKWKSLLQAEEGQMIPEAALLTAFISVLCIGIITIMNIYGPEIQELLEKLPQVFDPF